MAVTLRMSVSVTADDNLLIVGARRAVDFCKLYPALSNTLPRLVDSVIECLERALQTSSDAQATQFVLEQMRSLETRFEDRVGQLTTHVENLVTQQITGLEQQFGSSLLNLVAGTENAVRGCLERFNVDSLAGRVQDMVTHAMHSGNQNTETLVKEIVNELHTTVQQRHEQLHGVLREVPLQLQNLSTTLVRDDQETRYKHIQAILEMRAHLDTAVCNVSNTVGTMRDALRQVAQDVGGQGSLPLLVKATMTEALKTLDREATTTGAAVEVTKSRLGDMDRDVKSLQELVKGTQQRLDELVRQLATGPESTKEIGRQGENFIQDGLNERLSAHEGWIVESVAGTGHSCDLVVRKPGCSDIFIESKNHGSKKTGEVIRQAQVKRFEEDMTGLGTHGIFVALQGPIANKGAIDVVQLHTTGKFVVYLAQCEDVNLVHHMVLLLHRLDRACKARSDNGDGVLVSEDTIAMVRLYVGQVRDMAKEIKGLLQSATLRINTFMNEHLNTIDRLLLGVAPEDAHPEETQRTTATFKCDECDRVCKNRASLSQHKRMHKRTSDDADDSPCKKAMKTV